MKSDSDSEWFLKHKEGTTGPLSESDMREHVEHSTDDALLIRQGSSDWRSVDVIRRKISQLQKNGIFIRYKSVAEGPFTLTRAHDVLKNMPPGGLDVRTGATGQWVPAATWLAKIDKLLEIESKEMDSISIAVQHVLGRKGFIGPKQNSGELDLADADQEVVAAPKEKQPEFERPLWLGPEPVSEPRPVDQPPPVFEVEVTNSNRALHNARQQKHTEPVIEVVKVMHTAEITDRTTGKTRSSRGVQPNLITRDEKPSMTAGPKTGEVDAEASVPAVPEPTIRVRPKNHTSQLNRTRTPQEKLVTMVFATAIVVGISIAGWTWLVEPDPTIVANQATLGQRDTADRSPSDITEPNQPGNDSINAGNLSNGSPTEPAASIAGADSKNGSSTTVEAVAQSQHGTQADRRTKDEDDALSENPPRKNGTTQSPTRAIGSVDGSETAPLTLSTGTLFRPRFGTSEGEINAGTAFAAKLNGKSQVLILSALHLFGPSGGLKADIEPDQLATAWKKLIVEDCKTQNYFGEIRMQPINLIGAKPHPQKSELGDIAACTVKDATAMEALSLSQRIPSNGEHVWLLSKLPGSRGLLHAAVVERLDNGWLRYSLRNDNLNLKNTGGAPIVDHQGKVVAVNAKITQESGKSIGHGTPVVNFYPTLATLVQ